MAFIFTNPIENPQILGEVSGETSKLKDDNHQLSYKQIPVEWFSKERLAEIKWGDKKKSSAIKLPSELNPSLFGMGKEQPAHIRGEDIPIFKTPGLKQAKFNPPNSMTLGSLVMQNASGAQVEFGGPLGGPFENGQVQFSVQLDSQLPSLSFRLKEPVKAGKGEGPWNVYYRVIFFGNTSMKDVVYWSPADAKAGKLPCNIPRLHQKAAEEERLMGLTLYFGKSSNQDRFLDSICPQHNEKFPDGQDVWKSNDDMADQFREFDKTKIPLEGFRAWIERMFTTKDISLTFLRETNTKEASNLAHWKTQYEYWAYIMKLACEHGLFWFYRMQPRFDKERIGAQFNQWAEEKLTPPVPFWLIREAIAHVEDGKLVKLEPTQFAPIVPDPTSAAQKKTILPHPEHNAFLHELSIVRERAFEANIAGTMFDEERQHHMTLQYLTTVGKQVICRGEMSVRAGAQEAKAEHKVLPDDGTNLKLKFNFGPGLLESFSLEARVFEAPDKPVNVDLVLHCTLSRGKYDRAFRGTKGEGEKVTGMAVASVRPNFESVKRIMEAFRSVLGEMSDAEINTSLENLGPHPDPRHFLLRYKARFPGSVSDQKTVVATMLDFARSKDIKVSDQYPKEGLLRLLGWFGFPGINNSQLESILGSIAGGKGNLTVIHGPPGTGKSRTMACLVVVLWFVFGQKVGIAAPSNTAADAIMDKLVEVYHGTILKRGLKWDLVRFLTLSGTPIQGDAFEPVDESGFSVPSSGLDEVGMAQRNLWRTESRFSGFSFHEAKKTFARKNKDSSDKKIREACKDWEEMINAASQGTVFGDDKKKFQAADEMLGSKVMASKCDVLIGTLSSMGRDIARACPIEAIVCDEAGQATIGEICIPFNTFRSTNVRAIVGGDDLQLPSFLASERANEAAAYTTTSAFKEMRLADDEFSVHLLNVEYRSHPSIYAWSNKTFYENRVHAEEKLGQVTALDKTVSAIMQAELGSKKDSKGKLKWDPTDMPRLVVIDVNKPSAQWPGTTSSWNAWELEVCKFLRALLLEAVPPEGGEKIEGATITFISPYKGQVFALRDMCSKSGDPSSLTQTVHGSQGGEAKLGISSVAKNDPNRPVTIGFVSDPPGLNVWFTRQQRFHFVVGNFRARHQHRVALEQSVRSRKTYRSLLEYVVEGQGPGITLLVPEDFRSWPGYPADLDANHRNAVGEADRLDRLVRSRESGLLGSMGALSIGEGAEEDWPLPGGSGGGGSRGGGGGRGGGGRGGGGRGGGGGGSSGRGDDGRGGGGSGGRGGTFGMWSPRRGRTRGGG